jgi:hypothetical protein
MHKHQHPQQQQKNRKHHHARQHQSAGTRYGCARLCFTGLVSVAHQQTKPVYRETSEYLMPDLLNSTRRHPPKILFPSLLIE